MKYARFRQAFTLIELLIVVAIIAILAAIAVPNFLEAQTRAKVSRVQADMRTIAVGMESYYTDNNRYPVPYKNKAQGRPNNTSGYNVSNELTTPIAYLTNVQGIEDPFSLKQRGKGDEQFRRFGYIVDQVVQSPNLFQTSWISLRPQYKATVGKWRLDSFGPDERSAANAGDPSNWPNEPSYDATNGTISRGDIYRAHSGSSYSQPTP